MAQSTVASSSSIILENLTSNKKLEHDDLIKSDEVQKRKILLTLKYKTFNKLLQSKILFRKIFSPKYEKILFNSGITYDTAIAETYERLNAKGWTKMKIKPNKIRRSVFKAYWNKVNLSNSTIFKSNDLFLPSKNNIYEKSNKSYMIRGLQSIWLTDKDSLTINSESWLKIYSKSIDQINEDIINSFFVSNSEIFDNLFDKTNLTGWCIGISPDNHYVAIGTNLGKIYIYFIDKFPLTETNEELIFEESSEQDITKSQDREQCKILYRYAVLNGHSKGIMSIKWTNAAKYQLIISASIDGTVKIWQTQKQSELCTIETPGVPISVACVAIDNNYYAIIANLDGTVRLYQLVINHKFAHNSEANKLSCNSKFGIKHNENENLDELISLDYHLVYKIKSEIPITHMAVNEKVRLIILGTQHGAIKILDLLKGRLIREVLCRNSDGKYSAGEIITGLSFSSKGNYIIVSSADGRIRILNREDPRRIIKLRNHCKLKFKAIITPNDKYIISFSENGTLNIWDLEFSNLKPQARNRKRRKIKHFFSKNSKVTSNLREHHVVEYYDSSLEATNDNYLTEKDIITYTSIFNLGEMFIEPVRDNQKRYTSTPICSIKLPESCITAFEILNIYEKYNHYILLLIATCATGRVYLFTGIFV